MKSLGTTGNKQWDEFSLPRIWFEIQKLIYTLSFNNDYVFCHLIGALKFESDPRLLWQEKSLRTPDLLYRCGKVWAQDYFSLCTACCVSNSLQKFLLSALFLPVTIVVPLLKKKQKVWFQSEVKCRGLQGNYRISWGMVLCYTAIISPSKVF